MKGSAIVGAPVDAGAAGAQQRSQVAREKWEENWIAQQRDVAAVVAGQPRRSETLDITAARRLASSPLVQSEGELDPATSQQPRPSDAIDTGATSADILRKIDIQASRADRPTAPSLGVYVQAPIDASSPTEDIRASATRNRPAPRTTPNHFAFWRDGQALDAAMRLRDPAGEGGQIIAQLRRWLSDVGLRLRSVIINGDRSEW